MTERNRGEEISFPRPLDPTLDVSELFLPVRRDARDWCMGNRTGLDAERADKAYDGLSDVDAEAPASE